MDSPESIGFKVDEESLREIRKKAESLGRHPVVRLVPAADCTPPWKIVLENFPCGERVLYKRNDRVAMSLGVTLLVDGDEARQLNGLEILFPFPERPDGSGFVLRDKSTRTKLEELVSKASEQGEKWKRKGAGS
jgi:hypothetical protein